MKNILIIFCLFLNACNTVKFIKYENGITQQKTYLKKNKIVKELRYFKNGKLSDSYSTNRKGKKKYTSWYLSGKLKERGDFIKTDTLYVRDDLDSNIFLIKICVYGNCKKWYENGKIKEIIQYNNFKTQRHKYFNEEGVFLKESVFRECNSIE